MLSLLARVSQKPEDPVTSDGCFDHPPSLEKVNMEHTMHSRA